MDKLKRELEHLGFTQKEAAVYVASLELGSATAQEIAMKSRVNRATVYLTIETLAHRGLMSMFERGSKRYFAAESPERLLSLLKRRERVIQEKEQEAEKLLPMLLALYNSASSTKPSIRFLEGPEGVRAARELFEKQTGEFVQLVPFEEAQAAADLERGREDHLRTLAAGGASFRVLFVMREPDSSKLPNMPWGEMRMVARSQCPATCEITVRQDTIYLYAYAPTVLSVIITSREMAASMRAMFDLAWEGANR